MRRKSATAAASETKKRRVHNDQGFVFPFLMTVSNRAHEYTVQTMPVESVVNFTVFITHDERSSRALPEFDEKNWKSCRQARKEKYSDVA